MALLGYRLACPLVAGLPALCAILLTSAKMDGIPAFLSAFLLCLWCAMLECGSVSRFRGVFRGFYSADVYLYGLRSLRGLCGFCARVELGG